MLVEGVEHTGRGVVTFMAKCTERGLLTIPRVVDACSAGSRVFPWKAESTTDCCR